MDVCYFAYILELYAYKILKIKFIAIIFYNITVIIIMIMILAILIAIIAIKNKIIIRALFIHMFTKPYSVRATKITKRPTTFEYQNIASTSIDCGFLCIYIKFYLLHSFI